MEEQEIKRKFLPKNRPDLSNLRHEEFERYYLLTDKKIDLRIQRINNKYEVERMEKISVISRTKQKMSISQEEFNMLKSLAEFSVVRDSYTFSENPEIKIRVYHGKFEGLIRIEVEFRSEEEAKNYQPLDWFGCEITNTPLWRDSELLRLTGQEFSHLLKRYGTS